MYWGINFLKGNDIFADTFESDSLELESFNRRNVTFRIEETRNYLQAIGDIAPERIVIEEEAELITEGPSYILLVLQHSPADLPPIGGAELDPSPAPLNTPTIENE